MNNPLSIKAPTRAAHRKVLPWLLASLVLVGGIVTTGMVADEVRQQENRTLETLFEAEASRVTSNVLHRLQTYQVIMRGVQGFFCASEEVLYKEFYTYASTLDFSDTLAGVQGIAYVAALSREELGLHRRNTAGTVPFSDSIHPDSHRQVIAPILFIEPLTEANRRAVGFDIYSNPIAKEAANRARDSGKTVITPPLVLVQDAAQEQVPAIVMYLPVYRENAPVATVAQRRLALRGWVDVPIRVKDFMAHTQEEINPHIDIEIRDGALSDRENLLFHSDEVPHSVRGQHGELRTESEIAIGTRTWKLLLSTTPAWRAQTSLASRTSMIQVSGGSLSFALALLVFFVARNWDSSERRAARMTHLYAALSEINQAIVRMESQEDLFPLVCRMAVDYGDMKMAWVGSLDEECRHLKISAAYGQGTDALELDTFFDIGAESPLGNSPIALAVRTGEPVIVNDYFADARTAPWHHRARRFGWGSSAVFPIHRRGKPFAVLNVHHRKKDAFDPDAIGLLTEMTKDIGFALDNFDREHQRQGFQEALADSEDRLSTVLENVGACIYLKDSDGRYTFANRQLPSQWGVTTTEEVIGFTDERFFTHATVSAVKENDRQVLLRGDVLEKEEIYTSRLTGVTRTFWSVKLPLRRPDGSVYALCGISTDISDKKASEERIRYLSNYDSLTGLPNRELLGERARIALAAARANETGVALFCIDLDRFKIINESLGHGTGDLVLKQLSQRLASALHLNATLSRIGGDEFFLLLPEVGADGAADVARDLLKVIATPLEVEGHDLALTGSVGIALFPEHGRDFGQLIQSADAALAEAKQQGRNSYLFFSESLRVHASETLQLENELRRAVDEEQLVLHYQPQLDMESGRIIGVEALVRWQHPERGMIPPDKFIPIAEESGLIIDIGNWVLDRAASQLTAWQQEQPLPLSMAVNLSAVQLYKEDFCETIGSIMEKYPSTRSLLELEITERIAMQYSSYTIATLAQLHRMGVTLSIDDFGTGFSSLNYLKRYPVHKLKIDKSFVDGLGTDSGDQAIVIAIIGIARGLGFKTIAEGVETGEQWEFLRAHGCDAYQGYYFSKPVPAAELSTMLRHRHQ